MPRPGLEALARWVGGCALLLAPLLAPAAEVSLSGFLTLAGGQVLNGSRTTPYAGRDCPCFIADWTHLGMYDQDFALDRESRVGARMDVRLHERLKGSLQSVARATPGSEGADLDVALLEYLLAPGWSVQVGRKKLPIYYYSDFQDVGFAYPWVRPPQDLYGWEVSSFNGATLVSQGSWGQWNLRSSLFYGRERYDDSPMASVDSSDRTGGAPRAQVDVTWSDILGADVELTRDWFNLRMVYIQSQVDMRSDVGGDLYRNEQQRIYGVSANVDYGNWLVRSEYSIFDRWAFSYRSWAAMLGVGYHLGPWTPMVTVSHYRDRNRFDDPVQRESVYSATLRYDLSDHSAVKVQYDHQQDDSSPGFFVGNNDVISISYDRVF